MGGMTNPIVPRNIKLIKIHLKININVQLDHLTLQLRTIQNPWYSGTLRGMECGGMGSMKPEIPFRQHQTPCCLFTPLPPPILDSSLLVKVIDMVLCLCPLPPTIKHDPSPPFSHRIRQTAKVKKILV